MTNEKELEEVEIGVQEAKKAIEIASALKRLTEHPDFKEIIMEGYLEKEAIRLVHLKGSHSLSAENRANVDNMIYGVSNLKMYLANLSAEGRQMEEALKDYNEARSEILEEG